MTAKGAARKRAKEGAKGRKIEIAGETADLLQARAAALGISVAELLGAIAGNKPSAPPQTAKDDAQAAVASPTRADPPAPQAKAESEPPGERWREVKAWIDSWGKSNELPRPKLGK